MHIIKKLENNIVSQIESSISLVIFMWWAFFSFAVSFSFYIGFGYTSPYSPLPCWPHFLNCKTILPLTPLPFGYGESIFYAWLLLLVVYGAYSLYQKKYFNAYICILLLWLWKFFVLNVTYGIGNFDYYDLIIIGVFLFFSNKVHFLRLTFVVLYFLASTIKIGGGWIDGTYFTSLQTGVPLFPDGMAFIVTNIVIVMQIVGCWFLLSRNKYLFLFSFYFFIFFHLYSTILVGYRYPLTALFLEIILFSRLGAETTFKDLKIRLRDSFNWFVLGLLFMLQFIGILIPGNQKVTLEGNNYGLYMFEANHQCISTNVIKNGTTIISSADARNRCDPYMYLTYIKKNCNKINGPISWTFDSSVNGEPLYRIVDEKNACSLEYKPFIHNKWINIDNPVYISEVNKNIYDLMGVSRINETFIKKVDGKVYTGNAFIKNNKPSEKTEIQEYLYKKIDLLATLYWILWGTTMLFAAYLLTRNNS
jgi:hypothetical protein